MTPPIVSYYEWCTVLDRFATGDDAVLAQMESGTLSWTVGVADRFLSRLGDAIQLRFQFALKRLQRELSASGGREHDLSCALVSFRRQLAICSRAVALAVIPEAVRQELHKTLAAAVSNLEQSLYDSARQMGPGNETLLRVLRATPISLTIATQHPEGTPAVEPPGDGCVRGRKRRILL